MSRTSKVAGLFLGAVSMFILPALANRTNVRPAWNLFSTQQDIEMGRLLADDAERVLQVVDQPNAAAYIDALGKQLSVHAPGGRYPYQFKIVNDDSINAWALPGGYIYVTSGLVEAAQNEQELAGAVAHSIAHVVLRHGTAEVSQAYADQVPNASRNSISVNDAMSRLRIRFEPRSIPLKYSREEEGQADVIATQILYDARFDPQPMTDLFEAIADEGSSRTADFLDAHPDLWTALANVRTELRNLGGLPGNLRGDSPDFHSVQNRLSAANTGPFPGSVRNSVGNRPEPASTRMVLYAGRSIEFRYPDNWRVSEETDSLTVAPYDGFVSGSLAYGMTIATFDAQDNRFFGRNSFVTPGARPDNSRLANATDQLIDQLRQSNPNMRVIRNSGGRRVDGAQAMVVELTNDSPAGGSETDWLVTVFDRRGLLRYFIGVSPESDSGKYQPVFEGIVASVRFLD